MLRLVFGVLTLLILVGWSGWIDLSAWPVSIPVVLEHCAIRYQGANASVYFQGPGADRSCDSAASGWYRTTGPPLGSLACYHQRFFGLSWKVYDTGFMLLASAVCDQLSGGSSAPGGYVAATPTPTPSPTRTESPQNAPAALEVVAIVERVPCPSLTGTVAGARSSSRRVEVDEID